MIIDTHSHLNFKAYDNNRNEVIKRLEQEGVVCIDVGTNYNTSKNAVLLAEKNDNIFAGIGLHPLHVKDENFIKEKYKELARSKRVVAIGEIGLDYYYKPKSKLKQEQFEQLQKQVFLQQLEMAEDLGLPVIIHCRMAHQNLIEILKSKIKNQKSKLTGVVHCFTGNWDEAQKYIDLGFYLGINGIIFKLNLDEVVKNCPLGKILVETDCPYLTPPAEGKDKRNEPIFVKHVIQKIADLKEISYNEVAEKTTENAKKLFKLN